MLREPTEADAAALLEGAGVAYRDCGDYFQFRCPFHADRVPSAVIYKDRWLFKCFAGCGCLSWGRFYRALCGAPWGESGSFSLAVPVRKPAMSSADRRFFSIDEGKVVSVYDSAKALEYCRSRGVSDDFMRHFDFKATDVCRFSADESGRCAVWRDRLLIPINLGGEPYSLEGRDYTRRQTPKCLYPRGCRTDICFNQDELDLKRTLVVCEGIMDIHRVWSRFTRNVTCTFGVSLSDAQREFLRGADDLILFIDDDKAGRGSVSSFERFMPRDFRVAIVRGTDPGGADDSAIGAALSNAVPWNEFLMDDLRVFDGRKTFSLGA